MKVTFTRSCAVIALAASCMAQAYGVLLPSLKTTTSAHYQSISAPNDSDFFQFPAAALPGTVSSRSYANVSGFAGYGRSGHATLPDIECAWDDSDAFATASRPGLDGAYARVGGYSPQSGSPTDLAANASVEIVTNWTASGAAATAAVDLSMFLDGFLYVSKNSGIPDPLWANVMVQVDVESSLGTQTIFQTSSELRYTAGFGTSFFAANSASSANWSSAWANNSATLTSTNGVDFLYELNYLEVINDIVVVPTNEVFSAKYTLSVAAYNGEGASELFATSDFSNTSDFGLVSNDPNVTVTEVNLVPEPATFVALGLGTLLAAKRKKRG